MENDRNQGVLRLAVAMRGGVSLAVWIGGALAEIDRVCRIDDDPFAQALRDITRFDRVEVDILTGASAGGLNAALGGMALADKKRMNLRDIWIETADIDRLLESSTQNPRRSLLDGEFFRDEVIRQLEMLKKSAQVLPGADEQHVDAFLAATVFGGVEVTDQADPRFSDQRQEAYFHFRHQADNPAFSDLIRSDAPRSLGLAARASAVVSRRIRAGAHRGR